MISVSEAWKEKHEQLILPETFLEITMAANDVEVQNLATVTAEKEDTLSKIDYVCDGVAVGNASLYATLEDNLWVLDGSRAIAPSYGPYDSPGYVSADDSQITLTVKLSEVRNVTIPGFSIVWSSQHGEYPTSFSITVKRGTTVVGSTTVTGNTSNNSDVEFEVSSYDTLVITVFDWNTPNRRKRIDKVVFGRVLRFDKNDVLSFSHEQTGDLNSAELPQNHIEFSVDNSTGRWNPDNPGGLEKYLSERQEVRVRYGMDVNGNIEWIKAGTFYLSEWRTPSNGFEAHFVARDVFEFMLNEPYKFPTRTGTIMQSTNLYSDVATYSDVVETLAVGRSVTVYEEFYEDGNWYRVDGGWIYGSVIQFDVPFTIADLLADALSKVNLPQSFEVNVNPRARNQLAPYVSGYTVAEIVQMCANAAHCLLWQDREGALNVQPIDATKTAYRVPLRFAYAYPEIELSKPLRGVDVKYNYGFEYYVSLSNVGEDITLDNPLIGIPDVPAYWMQMVWAPRKSVSGEFRADPRLDLFDVVEVETKYGVLSPVMFTQIKYTYNGSFHTTYSGRVVRPEIIV